MLLRLQKIIAQAGIASRRHAEELIRSGQVRVNGEIVTELGSKADPEHDRVEVAGRVAEIPDEQVYIVLNKPPQVVSTMADPEGRKTLRNFLRGAPERVFPVGRLDCAASGLVLLSSDGPLTARVLRASARLRQTYWIKVKGRISESEMHDAGRAASAHFVPLKGPWAKRSAANPWYEVELVGASRDALGRSLKRQDHPIEKMKRVQLVTLELGAVPEGHYRRLEADEVDKFSRAVDRALEEKNEPASVAPYERPVVAPQRPAAPPSNPPPPATPIVRPSFAARSNRPQERPREPWRARSSGPPARNKSGSAPPISNFPRPGSTDHRPGAPANLRPGGPPKQDWRAQKTGPWRGDKSGSAPRSPSYPQPGAPSNRPGAPPKQDWRAQKSGPWRGNKPGDAPSSPNYPRPGAPNHRPGAPAKPDWSAKKTGPWRGNKTDGPPRAQKQPWPGTPKHRPGSPAKNEWRAPKTSPWRGNKSGGPPRSQDRPRHPSRPRNSGPKRGGRSDRDPRHTPRQSR
jgi:23S rRNA pseudouridine2605 synthase